MAKKMHSTPMLDELESGPWPSFVTGLKRLAKDNDMMVDLLGQLEASYRTQEGLLEGRHGQRLRLRRRHHPALHRAQGRGRQAPVPRRGRVPHAARHAAPGHALQHRHPAQDLRHLGAPRLRASSPSTGRAATSCSRACAPTRSRTPSTRSTSSASTWAAPARRCAPRCPAWARARCEQSCYDEAAAHRTVLNNFTDDIHRPSLPYKFKFKFSGCPNDCMNSIQRSDMAVIGTWRDNIRTDEKLARAYFAKHGVTDLVNDVVSRCPTKAIQLVDAVEDPHGPHASPR